MPPHDPAGPVPPSRAGAPAARLPASPTERLRGAGLRVTAVRAALLEALDAHPHADVESLAGSLAETLGAVSRQAVYDALRALSLAGLARRIEPAGSPARYESRVGDNHHHVVCRSCGATADVDCAVGAAPCLEPSDSQGFLLDEAEVTFWGLCPDCIRSRPEGAAPRTGPDAELASRPRDATAARARDAAGSGADPGTSGTKGARPR